MILLHFTADWCNPCKQIKPIIEEYILTHPEIEYRSIDVDDHFSTAQHFNIQSIPTLIIMDGEEVIARKTGLLSKAELEQLFNKE